jgi:hypothetical protein
VLARLAGELQLEALDQLGDAVGVHFELIAGAEPGGRLWVGFGDAPSSTSSAKNPSKPAGEMISRSLAGSSPAFQERMPLVARLEDQVSGAADQDFIAQ